MRQAAVEMPTSLLDSLRLCDGRMTAFAYPLIALRTVSLSRALVQKNQS
jgi:hypothetical protein